MSRELWQMKSLSRPTPVNTALSNSGIQLGRLASGNTHAPIVYFLQMQEWVKIGTTTNLVRRIGALSLKPSQALLIIPGDESVETAMHSLYAEYRIYPDREWFAIRGRLAEMLAVACNTDLAEMLAVAREPEIVEILVESRKPVIAKPVTMEPLTVGPVTIESPTDTGMITGLQAGADYLGISITAFRKRIERKGKIPGEIRRGNQPSWSPTQLLNWTMQ